MTQHLQRAQPEQVRRMAQMPGRLELEADDEQQEHDAELGRGGDRADIDHRARRVRPEHDADDEQPQHGAEAGALEQDDRGGARPSSSTAAVRSSSRCIRSSRPRATLEA